MPTYVYECEKCGKVFEIDQRITEPALEKCPEECGGVVHRLIQAPMILTGGDSRPSQPASGFS